MATKVSHPFNLSLLCLNLHLKEGNNPKLYRKRETHWALNSLQVRGHRGRLLFGCEGVSDLCRTVRRIWFVHIYKWDPLTLKIPLSDFKPLKSPKSETDSPCWTLTKQCLHLNARLYKDEHFGLSGSLTACRDCQSATRRANGLSLSPLHRHRLISLCHTLSCHDDKELLFRAVYCVHCSDYRLVHEPPHAYSFIPHPSCESRSFCPAAASTPDMWHVQPSEDPALTVAVAPCVKVMTCIYNIRSPNHSQGLWREQPPLWFSV